MIHNRPKIDFLKSYDVYIHLKAKRICSSTKIKIRSIAIVKKNDRQLNIDDFRIFYYEILVPLNSYKNLKIDPMHQISCRK